MSAVSDVRLIAASEEMLDALVDDRSRLVDLIGSPAPDGWPEFPEAIGSALEYLRAATERDRVWSMHFFVESARWNTTTSTYTATDTTTTTTTHPSTAPTDTPIITQHSNTATLTPATNTTATIVDSAGSRERAGAATASVKADPERRPGDAPRMVEVGRAAQRDWSSAQDGKRAGDPTELATALIAIADEFPPPRRFITGADGSLWRNGKIDLLRNDTELRRSLFQITDVRPVAA